MNLDNRKFDENEYGAKRRKYVISDICLKHFLSGV